MIPQASHNPKQPSKDPYLVLVLKEFSLSLGSWVGHAFRSWLSLSSGFLGRFLFGCDLFGVVMGEGRMQFGGDILGMGFSALQEPPRAWNLGDASPA